LPWRYGLRVTRSCGPGATGECFVKWAMNKSMSAPMSSGSLLGTTTLSPPFQMKSVETTRMGAVRSTTRPPTMSDAGSICWRRPVPAS